MSRLQALMAWTFGGDADVMPVEARSAVLRPATISSLCDSLTVLGEHLAQGRHLADRPARRGARGGRG